MIWGHCILLFVFVTASHGFPKARVPDGRVEEDGPITLFDSASGSECFKATLNMDILLHDDDDMMSITNSIESHEDDSHETRPLHVNTSNPIGLCPGEQGELIPGQPFYTGPALFFEWNQTSTNSIQEPHEHQYKVLLLWTHLDDAYYLDTMAVDLVIPHQHHPERMKHLQATLTDMRLFGIQSGQSLTVNKPEERQIVFDREDKACFVFESVQMELLIDAMRGVSVIMLACVVAAATIMMIAGGYFWYHGARDERIKKLSRQHDMTNPLHQLPPKQYLV